MPARPLRIPFTLLLVMLAAGAMATVYIATPVGVGLANDSVAYIAGARSILQGTGYSDIWLDSSLEAITHYPPLLSLSLAGIGLFGIDPLRGARILNIFLFGTNTLLIGILGWRSTRSQIAGLWLAALFMLNASLIRIHVFALSEPLYLCLSLLTFLCADLSQASRSAGITPPMDISSEPIETKQKMLWLVLSGLTAGLAFLTRYSALALLPTIGLALFLREATFRRKSWREQLKTSGLFLAGALPPMFVWFLRNKLVAGNVTNRTFQYHPITSENIQPGFYNFSQFLIPFQELSWRQGLLKSGLLEFGLILLGLALLIWLVIRSWQMLFQPQKDQPQIITLTTILYTFGYLGAVLFSMSFFDASTKFQPRILAPIYVTGMLLFITSAAWLWRLPYTKQPGVLHEKLDISRSGARSSLARQGFVILLALVTLTVSAFGANRLVTEFQTAGQGYASWKWHDSLVMASLRNLAPEIAIYTNTPPALYLVSGRASRVIPSKLDPVDQQLRSYYEQNVARMRADLTRGRAVLALFDTASIEDAHGTNDFDKFISGLDLLQKT
ncbi:MAG: phospholipid carrier-dependent glycosyltransferase, partial [Chloroflexota bacterium]